MKTKLYKIFFSVIFSYNLFTLQSHAQQVRVFNTENSGLPHNEITAMAIDAQGNKWFGTYYGEVIKFDDINWTVYNKSNSKLNGDLVSSIATDAQDNIWIGTIDFYAKSHGELLKFDNTNWIVYNNSNSGLPYAGITDIAIDALGNKWISTDGGGVVKFDDTNCTIYNSTNSGFLLDYIDEVEIDNQGNKWLHSYSKSLYPFPKLFKFDGIKWATFEIPEFEPAWSYYGHFTSIVIDAEGNKWMGTVEDSDLQGGIIKFDDETWSYYNNNNIPGLPRQYVMSIAIDAQGNKWFGMSGFNNEALVKFDGINWTVFNRANSGLPDMSIRSMDIDKMGNIWIATANSGVVEFNENEIITAVTDTISEVSVGDTLSGMPDDELIVYPDPTKNTYLSFTAFPNPTTEFLVLSVENFNNENLSFQVIDINGRVLHIQKITDGQTRFFVGNLASAMYGVQIVSGYSLLKTFKIIKN